MPTAHRQSEIWIWLHLFIPGAEYLHSSKVHVNIIIHNPKYIFRIKMLGFNQMHVNILNLVIQINEIKFIYLLMVVVLAVSQVAKFVGTSILALNHEYCWNYNIQFSRLLNRAGNNVIFSSLNIKLKVLAHSFTYYRKPGRVCSCSITWFSRDVQLCVICITGDIHHG